MSGLTAAEKQRERPAGPIPYQESPRRFVLGSKLLEVLLQIAVLTQDGGRFVTREVRIEELLAF